MGRKKKQTSGFTLVEVIVVLLIVGILLAITIPAIMGYVKKAHDVKDQVSVSYLNKATQAYGITLKVNDKITNNDIFDTIADSKKRQEKLMTSGWLDELLTSYEDDTDFFYWDIPEQIWKIDKDAKGEGTTEIDINKTILGQNNSQTFKGDWNAANTYTKGDVVKTSDGKIYKWIGSSTAPTLDPTGKDKSAWKEIKLEYDAYNVYEYGDIILDKETNTYYKATYQTQNYYDYQSFAIAQGGNVVAISDQKTGGKKVWQKVEYDEHSKDFIDAQ